MNIFGGSGNIDRRKVKLGSDLDVGPATIEIAYKELSGEAFAVWCMLCTLSRKELRAGTAALAESLGLKPLRAKRILTELRRMGYIYAVKDHGSRTAYVIFRKLLIQPGTRGVVTL